MKIIPRVSVSTRLADHITVFQSETYAMMSVLEKCNDDEIVGKTVKIFTGSKSLMQSLERPAKWSRILWRCVIALNRLARLNEVTLIWCPGHSGVIGNEEADRLAVIGSEQSVSDDSMDWCDYFGGQDTTETLGS